MRIDTAHTPALIAVTFARSHTHAGVAYAPGDTLRVYKLDAAWLVAQGVACFTDTPAAPTRRTPNGDVRRPDTTGDNHGS